MATGTTALQIIDVVTPAAGESVTEGTILEWHVKVGDFIKADDTIVEISTDKVDLELPSPASGTVSEVLIEEGETVTVGQVIARIVVDGAAGAGAGAADGANGHASGADPVEGGARTDGAGRAETDGAGRAETDGAGRAEADGDGAAAVAEPDTRTPAETPEGTKASPVAQRAAAAEGVDLAGLSGSGPAGRITKSDVLAAAGGDGAART